MPKKKSNIMFDNSRKTQFVLFNDFIKLNNIRFSSPYFQALAGQEQNRNIFVKSIKIKEFKKIIRQQNPKQIRKHYLKDRKTAELTLIGRDVNGKLQGSINVSTDNKIKVYFSDPDEQAKIIQKNTKKEMSFTKKLLSGKHTTPNLEVAE